MRKLGLLLLPLLIVACGKNELITNARETTGDILKATGKAFEDTLNEADRSADSVITKANDAKNEVLSNTGNFTESIGDGAESIAQAPKKAINQLLGNDPKSEEKNRELTNDLADLQQQVDDMYQEMLESFSDTTDELGQLKGEINRVQSDSREADEELKNALDQIHNELLAEINQVDRKSRRALRKIRRLQRRLRGLQSDIRDLQRNSGNRRIICRTYGNRPYHASYYRTYCRLVGERDFDEEDDD